MTNLLREQRGVKWKSFTPNNPFGIRSYSYSKIAPGQKAAKFREAYQVRIRRDFAIKAELEEERILKEWLAENKPPPPVGTDAVEFRRVPGSGACPQSKWAIEFRDYADALRFWLRFCDGAS